MGADEAIWVYLVVCFWGIYGFLRVEQFGHRALAANISPKFAMQRFFFEFMHQKF